MTEHAITETSFASLDLHPTLLSGLHATGFTHCTPIQALSLPIALTGRDVAGQAQTGSGKTGAFLVAVMHRMLTLPPAQGRKPEDPRVVVIAPTRELAIQIDRDFQKIGRDTGLRSALIYGGVDYDKQRDMLRAGCDVIIATPGRLIDYFKQGVFRFDAIEAVIIDEADRMFDLGFIKDIRYLLRRMPDPSKRQGLLFSATLSHRVLELAYEHMNEPEKVEAETATVTAPRVRQRIYFPAKEEKVPLLLNLLTELDDERALVFVNTRAAAERVSRSLERHGYTVGGLSGDVPQRRRESLLNRFKQGTVQILVATDVAARGLHVPAVSHVFNYDLPQDAEDYVHRIGRTARLGAEGDAVSFACDLYAMSLPEIEDYISQKIPVERVTAELLKTPPRKQRAAAPAEASRAVESEAAQGQTRAADEPAQTQTPPDSTPADAEASAEDAPAASTAPRKRRRRRRRPATAQGEQAQQQQHEQPQDTSSGDSQPETPATAAGQAAPRGDGQPARRRRRRGGRGRGRGGRPAGDQGQQGGSATQGTTAASPSPSRRGGSQRPRPQAAASSAASPPPAPRAKPAQVKAAKPAAAEPTGLLKRIGKIFFGER